MTTGIVQYQKLHVDAQLPRRSYGDAIGFDLPAFLISETGRTIQAVLPPRSTRVIPTGLMMIPPKGYFFCICSRSGHAAGTPPIFVANAPGIIDPDFTGELKVILFNGGYDSVYIKHGDFIAQLVLLARGPEVQFTELTIAPNTERGGKGFGSSDEPVAAE